MTRAEHTGGTRRRTRRPGLSRLPCWRRRALQQVRPRHERTRPSAPLAARAPHAPQHLLRSYTLLDRCRLSQQGWRRQAREVKRERRPRDAQARRRRTARIVVLLAAYLRLEAPRSRTMPPPGSRAGPRPLGPSGAGLSLPAPVCVRPPRRQSNAPCVVSATAERAYVAEAAALRTQAVTMLTQVARAAVSPLGLRSSARPRRSRRAPTLRPPPSAWP